MAAVLAADLEGYSARVAQDEEAVVGQVRALLSEVVAPALGAAGGRMVKTMGDGFLAEFASPVSAACRGDLHDNDRSGPGAAIAGQGAGLDPNSA